MPQAKDMKFQRHKTNECFDFVFSNGSRSWAVFAGVSWQGGKTTPRQRGGVLESLRDLVVSVDETGC